MTILALAILIFLSWLEGEGNESLKRETIENLTGALMGGISLYLIGISLAKLTNDDEIIYLKTIL